MELDREEGEFSEENECKTPNPPGDLDVDMSIDSDDQNYRAQIVQAPAPKQRRCLHGPSVEISYKGLTRQSRKKLEELLSAWAGWQAEHEDSSDDQLEEGKETYFGSVNFWVDRPVKRSREMEDEVPFYDRSCDMLQAQDGSLLAERKLELPSEEASRCFNCGSYSHALRDCSRPRDFATIANARKLHQAKRGNTGGTSSSRRYYEPPSGGKFDGIKPGILGSVTRRCLGIGENDPPPWLNRMREIGYPPGYLDCGQDEAVITLYEEATTEEGEITEVEHPAEASHPAVMTVEFPGINAPIPENADRGLWLDPSHGSSQLSSSTTTSLVLQKSFSDSGRIIVL